MMTLDTSVLMFSPFQGDERLNRSFDEALPPTLPMTSSKWRKLNCRGTALVGGATELHFLSHVLLPITQNRIR
jgi:hypothetical protein